MNLNMKILQQNKNNFLQTCIHDLSSPNRLSKKNVRNFVKRNVYAMYTIFKMDGHVAISSLSSLIPIFYDRRAENL